VRCPACGHENDPANRFCESCGRSLAATCPQCGSAVTPGARFCGKCGADLTIGPEGVPDVEADTGRGPSAVAERRLVSILFADLVGFTTIAERRDPEEVRDILSTYFDRMREIVSRHGGTIEKFIGDAVMAVWGTPTAHEDDAERAVRTGLSMVDAVDRLNEELHLPEKTLAIRVGVLTGEAAITVGAEGQGMVAGDLVNTASRVQATAPRGWVLVDGGTRRATESAIALEEAPTPMLKGKSVPIPVWRALRIVAGRGGSGKALGLEAPFVGRDEELRQVIDLFHATAREHKARLVSVSGLAGVGKSRLAWEFQKYSDGLVEPVLWHRGRCLSYGEGVTYWALAEMIRMRAGILEDEASPIAAAKLREAVVAAVPDVEERDWIEPRLGHLLGLDAGATFERQELFGAWRLFFERLSEPSTVVMVFEDLQWADAAVLDFIEYLLDWARNRPIFILTLARPELAERRPGWGASARAFGSLFLEPLPSEAMEDLVRGLVPGLPDELVTRICDRAEGVPLYAVETIRMLLDRGLVRQEESGYIVASEVDALTVPETLQSLISARLDGLPERERALLRDASVLGKTFGKEALAALTGQSTAELDELLDSLTRKELLGVERDPRSPELGQYGFLQDLVREVAYQTLTKKERKARHLAVARYLQSDWPEEEEVVQIVASHYLEAFRLAPDATDAPQVQTQARTSLDRAGERAASLGASEEARRYFERALELAHEPLEQARLMLRAGEMAWDDGQADEAIAYGERALQIFEAEGGAQAARASALLARWLWNQYRIDEALQRMEEAVQVLSGLPPDEGFAEIITELGRLYFFRGDRKRALEQIEEALRLAEELQLPGLISQGLNTKSLILSATGRLEESLALVRHSLLLAEGHGDMQAALRAYNNLVVMVRAAERHAEALELGERALALSRRVGSRSWEWQFAAQNGITQIEIGLWDEALHSVAVVPDPEEVPGARWPFAAVLISTAPIHLHRGELDTLERSLTRVGTLIGDSHDAQARATSELLRATVLLARGDYPSALAAAEETLRVSVESVGFDLYTKHAFAIAVTSAIILGEMEKTQELVDFVATRTLSEVPPGMRGHAARFRAMLAVSRGETEGIEPEFRGAEEIYEEIGTTFDLAVVRLEHAEWLAERGEEARARELLEQARATFERLRATPWLERADKVRLAEAAAGV
jgi:predicted ATPase/class 3 adenylate cyclase